MRCATGPGKRLSGSWLLRASISRSSRRLRGPMRVGDVERDMSVAGVATPTRSSSESLGSVVTAPPVMAAR